MVTLFIDRGKGTDAPKDIGGMMGQVSQQLESVRYAIDKGRIREARDLLADAAEKVKLFGTSISGNPEERYRAHLKIVDAISSLDKALNPDKQEYTDVVAIELERAADVAKDGKLDQAKVREPVIGIMGARGIRAYQKIPKSDAEAELFRSVIPILTKYELNEERVQIATSVCLYYTATKQTAKAVAFAEESGLGVTFITPFLKALYNEQRAAGDIVSAANTAKRLDEATRKEAAQAIYIHDMGVAMAIEDPLKSAAALQKVADFAKENLEEPQVHQPLIVAYDQLQKAVELIKFKNPLLLATTAEFKTPVEPYAKVQAQPTDPSVDLLDHIADSFKTVLSYLGSAYEIAKRLDDPASIKEVEEEITQMAVGFCIHQLRNAETRLLEDMYEIRKDTPKKKEEESDEEEANAYVYYTITPSKGFLSACASLASVTETVKEYSLDQKLAGYAKERVEKADEAWTDGVDTSEDLRKRFMVAGSSENVKVDYLAIVEALRPFGILSKSFRKSVRSFKRYGE